MQNQDVSIGFYVKILLRSKGSENFENIPSFEVMPHQGMTSNSTEGQTEQTQILHQELLQEKDEKIAALRETIGEEKRKQVDKDDELKALREKLRYTRPRPNHRSTRQPPVYYHQMPAQYPLA